MTKVDELIDGRRSVCEGHCPDCACEACCHVRRLLQDLHHPSRETPEAKDRP